MKQQISSYARSYSSAHRVSRGIPALILVIVFGVAFDFALTGCGENDSSPVKDVGGNDLKEEGGDTPKTELKREGLIVSSHQGTDSKDNLSAWPTEVIAGKVDRILTSLGELFLSSKLIQEIEVIPFISTDLACGPLVPNDLAIAFDNDSLTVWRGGHGQAEASERTAVDSTGDFAAQLKSIWAPYTKIENASFKFKTIGVSVTPEGVLTSHLFSSAADTAQGLLEQHATWAIRWTVEELRISSIEVSGFERVLVRDRHQTIFKDCTKSILRKAECYVPQLLHGYNHWLRRMESPPYMYNLGSPAIAIADVNGDGLDDFYLSQEHGLPNRLFLQQEDGSAREVSAEWGVDWIEDSRGALLIDLDNDGDQDLAVAVIGGVVLAENDGQRRFIMRTVLPTSDATMSLASVDYDSDGRLDLYVCAYHPTLSGTKTGRGGIAAAGERFVYHDANDGGANHLFRNVRTRADGWRFDDVTQQVGLDENNARYSFAASWEDYDNDHDLDLYVANDFGRDNLYRNDDGKFIDVAEQAGAENSGSGMAITWGDYDRDGWMDAYVSNMFSAAGRRIATQPGFMADAPEIVRKRLLRFARGNTLLRNTGNGSFVERASNEGVEIGRWAWASMFADLNNDGWEDLLVANGFITTDDTGDL